MGAFPLSRFHVGLLLLLLISQCVVEAVVAINCNNPRDRGDRNFDRRCGNLGGGNDGRDNRGGGNDGGGNRGGGNDGRGNNGGGNRGGGNNGGNNGGGNHGGGNNGGGNNGGGNHGGGNNGGGNNGGGNNGGGNNGGGNNGGGNNGGGNNGGGNNGGGNNGGGNNGGGNNGGGNNGGGNNGGLTVGFYSQSCPNAENIVRAAFTGNFLSDPTAPAALLRLVFHDCQVGGCDASILLDSTSSFQSELRSDRNFGIRRLDFIDRIKGSLEAVCPGVVSCADIIVLVARDSISITGGPRIAVQTGRRDSLTASNQAADASLPSASVSINNFLNIFQSKGMTVDESVAILGAHTIGVGHCVNILDRLYPTADQRLGPLFSGQLRAQCPTSNAQSLNNNTIINNDLTNLIFDNQYFRDVNNGRGLFTIDAEVGIDSSTSAAVAKFAQNQQLFFNTFASAFNKLAASNVLTGNNGQIRRNCHAAN